MKTVLIENTPFAKMKQGVDDLANTVRATLGPTGKNVLIDTGNRIISTRDGVSVANKIKFSDTVKNMAAMLVREAATETNKEAGDGTTTATILTQAIFSEALKDIYSEKTKPLDLKNEIETTVKQVIEELKKIARPVNNYDDILNIATISSNNDPVLGKLIADAVHMVGKKGTVIVEVGHEMKLIMQDGLTIERGLSDTGPAFITNAAKITAEYENPFIAVVDDKVADIAPLLPLLEYCKDKPLILCVKKIEDSVLGVLAKNKINGRIKIAVLITPGFNDNDIVEDFATSVGAKVINPDYNPMSDFKPEMLGGCEKIIIGLEQTTLINCKGSIDDRIETIEQQLLHEEDKIKKGRLQDRINKLSNSIAIIKITADSETELKDKKLRIEDSINASKAAMEEGIIEGGGIALARLSGSCGLTSRIIKAALMAPFRCIIENSGGIPEVVFKEIEATGMGYNAKTGLVANLFEEGIVDPVKVTRTALQKASSAAIMLLTTGPCLILEKENEQGK
jgi:chaperonin GroEL